MEEFGTPPKLMDERLGHEDGSVQSPLLPRHAEDAAAADGRPDRGVAGVTRSEARTGPWLPGGDARRAAETASTSRDWETAFKIFSQFSPKAAPGTTQGPCR
jgi:hypothetical protein